MKKVVLFALLAAATANVAAAEVYMEPLPGAVYHCDYGTPLPPSKDPGDSVFDITRSLDPSGLPIFRGIEYFDGKLPNGTVYLDNRKVTFAKPLNLYRLTPQGEWVLDRTRWEFTINPGGPQCTNTLVREWGHRIIFGSCSDGHTRTCTTY